MCVVIKLHITAQSGPVIYSFYATACPLGGLLFVDIFLARNVRASSHNSSPHYDGSWPEPHSLDHESVYVCVLCVNVCACVCFIAHNRAIRPCNLLIVCYCMPTWGVTFRGHILG